jgi:hypothetical protein
MTSIFTTTGLVDDIKERQKHQAVLQAEMKPKCS